MKYSCNSLLQWHDDGKTWLERVLWIDPASENVVCIRIEIEPDKQDQSSWPFCRSKEDLEVAFTNQQAKVLEKDAYLRPPVAPEKLSDVMKVRWNKNWEAIKPMVADPCKLFGALDQRWGDISAAAEKSGLDRRTIYRLLWKYWKGGQTQQCVLPDYRECGGKTRKFLGGGRRGRWSELEKEKGERIGLVITDDIKVRIRRGLAKHYNNPKERTLEQAYDLIIKDEFSIGGEIVNGAYVPTLLPEEELPSLRQVEFIHYNSRNPEQESKTRKGENIFNLKGRPILGNSETEVAGPGEEAQIDATTADIYLRSEYNPRMIVGRPTIYGIKDVFARFLYACTATFERPSYWGAAIALENALEDKVRYCAQYGITIGPDEWPVNFLPHKLRADRGELSTYKSDHLVTGLGIRIGNLPPRRGDLKGIIEQQFRLMNVNLINWLDGALPRFRDKKDDKRRELDATYTISQFRRLLIQAILNYHRTLLTEYKLGADMIAAGVQARPIELLHWGRDHRTGCFRTFDLDQARFHLLPHGEAKITGQGIRFGRVFFTCDRAVREQWYSRARRFGVQPMEVAFDPRRVDKIWFQVAKNTIIEEAVLIKADSRFSGWTWEEVEEQLKEQKIVELESRHQRTQDRVALVATAEQTTAEAEKILAEATAAAPPQSEAGQVGSIPENQKAEKMAERRKPVQEQAATEPAAPDEPAADNIVQLPASEPPPSAPPKPAPTPFMLAVHARKNLSKNKKS